MHSDNYVSLLHKQLALNARPTVIHVTDSNCSCNVLTQAHIVDLDKQLAALNFQIHAVDIKELKSLIPAAPAVLIFSKMRDLLYAGPYSSGYLCNKDNSLVDLALQQANYAIENNLKLEPFIVSQGQGCFCYPEK